MRKFDRIFLIVLDSLGVGEMEDAFAFGDEGSNTLKHISESVDSFCIPNLQKMGIANICPMKQVSPVEKPIACYGKLKEKSRGKDTMTGHWEMMGLEVKTPFQTFTENGFPKGLIQELGKRTGRRIIGNKSASGTEILEELAEEQIATGAIIVYTSADSVLQICGNEETLGLQELYRCCKIARELTLCDEWKVGRVIARPYIGKKKGEFKRTENRHDYALKPFAPTILNFIKEKGLDVYAVGKINDIFCGEGVTKAVSSSSSIQGMDQTIQFIREDFKGLCFTNLVDFDALWGHRRDPKGYALELEKFDEKLGDFLDEMKENDLLILTADHGNDPTYKGTDHTREKVPLLMYAKGIKGKNLREGDTFADIGATIADNFYIEKPDSMLGTSLLNQLY